MQWTKLRRTRTWREWSLMKTGTEVFAAALMSLAWLAGEASAQYPRYVPPAGRTLPDDLHYFRRDVGLLDQYNGFVAPLRQLDYQLRTMQNQQRADFQASERAISQIRTSRAAPTGVAAGFMNYSHYYRPPAQIRR